MQLLLNDGTGIAEALHGGIHLPSFRLAHTYAAAPANAQTNKTSSTAWYECSRPSINVAARGPVARASTEGLLDRDDCATGARWVTPLRIESNRITRPLRRAGGLCDHALFQASHAALTASVASVTGTPVAAWRRQSMAMP